MATKINEVEMQPVLDRAPFNKYHLVILFWCAAVIIFDGYDLAVVGIALPSIMKEMNVDATAAGFMVSSALFGMMFGNIMFGVASERFGRKPVIALCIVLFSVFTAAAGLAEGPLSFSATRFMAGVGIGGVMPNVIAQMTEYSPIKIRNTLVTLMFSGYSVGGMLAALVGKSMIESLGWRPVFFAAIAPLALVPFLYRQMPESLAFLQRSGRSRDVKDILSRIDPTTRQQPDVTYVVSGAAKNSHAKLEIGAPFLDGRAFSTLMLWLACFMCLFMVYALSSWLTKLMASAGYSLGSALSFVLALNFGAMLGAVGGGWLADRFHIKYVLILMYAIAAVSIALLGNPLPQAALYILVALAGASTIGTQIVMSSYCSQFYPPDVRSTGVGLMLAAGRVGAIAAPILIGVIVGMNLSLQSNFFAIAIPAVIACLAMFAVQHRRSYSAREGV